MFNRDESRIPDSGHHETARLLIFGAKFYPNSLHFRSFFFRFLHELALPITPLFMWVCGFFRVATLTGLSLLKAGLHAKGLRLGIALTRGWSNRGSNWLRHRLWRP